MSSIISKKNKKSQSQSNSYNETSIFSNPIAITVIMSIAILFIVYGIYFYIYSTDNLNRSHTYYGQDIRTWQPLFTLNTEHIEPCIERCTLDPSCGGITMDRDALVCTGTKTGGQLRQDTDRYTAWVKSANKKNTKFNIKDMKDIIGYRVLGMVDSPIKVEAKDGLPGLSSSSGFYNISMYILLSDFYEAYGKWRHITHLGTDPQLSSLIGKSSSEWTAVSSGLPDQLPGLWIAPHTNNMRLAMTTIQYPNHTAKDNQHSGKAMHGLPVKRVEWIDIGNTPPNGRLTHVSVNVFPEMVEVYINGKLNKTMMLRGKPLIMNEQPDMYFKQMPRPGFNGMLQDIIVVPRTLTPGEIYQLSSNAYRG